MRIAIFGAGALGSLLGAILSRKNDVLLIARGKHLEAIRERGLELRGLTKGKFYLEAEEHYPGGHELVILTVKAYQTEEAVKDIAREYGGEPILTFQNGLGVVDMLKDFDTIPGVITHGATLIEPGVVMHAGYGDAFIGEINGEISERVISLAENFTQCGLRTEVVNDIMERRWIKAAVNACINPLTAILGVKNGVLREENLDAVVRCIADSCGKLLAEKGIYANVYEEARKVIESTSENNSSMLQDIQRGKKTEVDFILKPFVVNDCMRAIYRMVKFLEKRGEGDFEPKGEIHPQKQRGEGDSNPRGQ